MYDRMRRFRDLSKVYDPAVAEIVGLYESEDIDVKIRVIEKLKRIEFRDRKISDFQSMRKNFRKDIGKTLRYAGSVYCATFDQSFIRRRKLPELSHYIPAVISPVPDMAVYESVLIRKNVIDKPLSFIELMEVRLGYDIDINDMIIFVEDARVLDPVTYFTSSSKKKNEFLSIIGEVFGGEKESQLSNDVCAGALSSGPGLGYSVSSSRLHRFTQDLFDIYVGLQNSMPPIFRKNPVTFAFDPTSRIFLSGSKLTITYYPIPAIDFDENLALTPFHRARMNQSLFSACHSEVDMARVIEMFQTANLLTNLEHETTVPIESLNSFYLPILDPEISHWLICQRNLYARISSEDFERRFTNWLLGTFWQETLSEECIRTAAKYSLVKEGYKRSFEAFYRLGMITENADSVRHFADGYVGRIESFLLESQSVIPRYLKKMSSDLRKLSGENWEIKLASNATRSMLMIAKAIPMDEMVTAMVRGLEITSELAERAIKKEEMSQRIIIKEVAGQKVVYRLFEILPLQYL